VVFVFDRNGNARLLQRDRDPIDAVVSDLDRPGNASPVACCDAGTDLARRPPRFPWPSAGLVQTFTFNISIPYIDVLDITPGSARISDNAKGTMITPGQMKAARALLGWDQRRLAKVAGVSLPTVQRMESSEGNVRGNVDTLVKVVDALARGGVTLIAEGATSGSGGRGVRLTD